jgi:hypothetical protein
MTGEVWLALGVAIALLVAIRVVVPRLMGKGGA